MNDKMPKNPANCSSAPFPGSARSRRRVLQVIYPGVKLLDISGPLQVFRDASQFTGGTGGYSCQLLSPSGGAVATDTGIVLETRRLSSVRVRSKDLLLVHGGDGVFAAAAERALPEWLARHALRADLYGSTCTGAFLLAAAGLLDDRRAVTHWNCCRRLQSEYPAVRVEADPIFLEDRGAWTSAGVTAGIDLALALVEQDFGRQTSLALARSLVMYSRRPGGQAQFSPLLRQQVRDIDSPFEELHAWIRRHLSEKLPVRRLAKQVH
ncbi:MAG TPA: AraC family transcriptional regulator, partial [Planctomycetaceae bacterium]|nr:AraC family transcriptional regulator [Planctomycetaceae bacterium]